MTVSATFSPECICLCFRLRIVTFVAFAICTPILAPPVALCLQPQPPTVATICWEPRFYIENPGTRGAKNRNVVDQLLLHSRRPAEINRYPPK
jgi:hypothetical protein